MKPAKKIAQDTFEKVKEETKKATEEVKPQKFVEDVVEQIGLKPQESGTEQPQAGQLTKTQKAPTDDAKRKAQTTQRLQQLEEEIGVIRRKREQEEEEVRRGEVKEDVEAGRKITQLGEEKEKSLPPPIVAAKRKAGTGERRIKGPSG